MPEKLFIPLVLGTARAGRQSEKVARLLFSLLQAKSEIDCEFVDVRDFRLDATVPPWGEQNDITQKWRELAARASGFIFVVPEYNHSFPGEFKMLLDMAFQEYSGKTAALVGVSGGGFGGVRMIEHLQPVLNYMQFIPTPKPLSILNVENMDQSYTERMQNFIDGAVEFCISMNIKK